MPFLKVPDQTETGTTVEASSPAAVAATVGGSPGGGSPLTGIGLKLISVVFMIAMSALVKEAAARGAPPGQTVFFRSFFALPIVLIWLMYRRQLSIGLRTSRPWSHLGRSLLGTGGMVCNFTGLALLPLPEVVSIFYAVPLFVTIFAAIFLGERIRLFRIGTVIIGMCGVMIVMWPRVTAAMVEGDTMHAIGALIVLFGAVSAALAQITIRKMSGTEHVGAIVFYFTALTAGLALLTVPFGWPMPDFTTLIILIGTGIVGGIGQILLTASFRYADAAVVSSFEFVSVVLSIIVGYIFFAEVPTGAMLIGAALVVAAGVALAWRERYRQVKGR